MHTSLPAHSLEPHIKMDRWSGEDSISVERRRSSREGHCAWFESCRVFVGLYLSHSPRGCAVCSILVVIRGISEKLCQGPRTYSQSNGHVKICCCCKTCLWMWYLFYPLPFLIIWFIAGIPPVECIGWVWGSPAQPSLLTSTRLRATTGSVTTHVGIAHVQGVQWIEKSGKSRFDLWISPGKLDKHQ